jgi:urease accessory protein
MAGVPRRLIIHNEGRMSSLDSQIVAASAGAESAPEGWCAELELRFAARGARTYLIERAHRGPLLVQRPFYPEGDVCHTYIVHPPGGVVGGDRLALTVRAEPEAHALITTPAAAKFYRSSGAVAEQIQTIRADDAAVEWLPQETIFYPGARVRSKTHVRLTGNARFFGWEIACLGLPAREQQFERGELHLGYVLDVDGNPRWIDRLRISGEAPARTAAWGLGGFNAIGTMLVYPATHALLEEARAVAHDKVESATTLVDGVLVCRALGAQAEPVRCVLVKLWERLRPRVLERMASAPRIWLT